MLWITVKMKGGHMTQYKRYCHEHNPFYGSKRYDEVSLKKCNECKFLSGMDYEEDNRIEAFLMAEQGGRI